MDIKSKLQLPYIECTSKPYFKVAKLWNILNSLQFPTKVITMYVTASRTWAYKETPELDVCLVKSGENQA